MQLRFPFVARCTSFSSDRNQTVDVETKWNMIYWSMSIYLNFAELFGGNVVGEQFCIVRKKKLVTLPKFQRNWKSN